MLRSAAVVLLACVGVGCAVDRSGLLSRDAGGGLDSGSARDAGADAGAVDGGSIDAGSTDAGSTDAGSTDAGSTDAGSTDAGRDAGSTDGGVDAGCPDAGTPPALTVWARPASTIVVDGALSEWSTDGVTVAAPADFVQDGTRPVATGAADLSARLAARWSSDALYFAVVVTDDVHHGGDAGELLWRGDSVQLAFDVDDDGGSGYDADGDFEYGYTLASGGVERYRWWAPPGAPAPVDTAAIVRTGTATRYEIRLTPSDLGLASFSEGATLGFSFLVNENDSGGPDRQGFLEWSSGIGHGKNPGAFGALVLRGSACP